MMKVEEIPLGCVSAANSSFIIHHSEFIIIDEWQQWH
jgi:hypothetical protein